jgi:CspA family cold shock protein
MSSSSVSFSPDSPSERFTGRVKWFNNKAGYGFVTITDGRYSGKDVFVHHTSINVDSEQYKYLVQGEYIEFCLSDTKGQGDHEYQAGNVSGINGGKLMCETRRESRSVRTQYRSSNAESSEQIKMPRATAPPRARGEGPREESDREWSYARNTAGRGRGRGGPSRGRGHGRGEGRSQEHQV